MKQLRSVQVYTPSVIRNSRRAADDSSLPAAVCRAWRPSNFRRLTSGVFRRPRAGRGAKQNINHSGLTPFSCRTTMRRPRPVSSVLLGEGKEWRRNLHLRSARCWAHRNRRTGVVVQPRSVTVAVDASVNFYGDRNRRPVPTYQWRIGEQWNGVVRWPMLHPTVA